MTRELTACLRGPVFGLRLEVQGLEHVPPGEPLIIAGGPHRNGMDAFVLLHALPGYPRIYFLGSREAVAGRWINRVLVSRMGGLVPVATGGQLNREALATALEILAAGASLGIFPEGWDIGGLPPDRVMPLKRGVGFLALRSGRRVLPVALAATQEHWRSKTLRVRIGRPLSPPTEGTTRERETVLAAELERTLNTLQPPSPPEPADGRKPWRWLTNLVG
jgi:1-acyl-sn-glycerol-3-phosphate acyltransferase